jgi:hypothetical protein
MCVCVFRFINACSTVIAAGWATKRCRNYGAQVHLYIYKRSLRGALLSHLPPLACIINEESEKKKCAEMGKLSQRLRRQMCFFQERRMQLTFLHSTDKLMLPLLNNTLPYHLIYLATGLNL